MFCSACGQQLPDAANFCHACGTPNRWRALVADPGLTGWPLVPSYETCEVVLELIEAARPGVRVRGSTCCFLALILGPGGWYKVGQSEETFELNSHGSVAPERHTCDWNAHTARCLEQLTDALIRDGWAPTGRRSDTWYNLGFWRPVDAARPRRVVSSVDRRSHAKPPERSTLPPLTGEEAEVHQWLAKDALKAARKRDVYELVRLTHVYEGSPERLREIDYLLRTVICNLSPARNREELAHLLKAADSPELLPSMDAAQAALVSLGSSATGVLRSTGCSASEATKRRVDLVEDAIGTATD